MLPKDFLNFMPDPLVENLDESGQALREYLNEFTLHYFNKILGMFYFKFPEITDCVTCDYWGEYLAADIQPNDTERQKREKIAKAVQTHKLRGTWKYDLKIKIDNITGKDSELVENTYKFEDDDSIIVSDNSSENSDFSTIGTDGINEFGTYIPEITSSVELLPGIVAIDLGYTIEEVYNFQDDDSIITSDNSAEILYYFSIGVDGIDGGLGTYVPSGEIDPDIEDILNKIETDILDSVPAYEILYLGYIDDDGNFQVLKII